MDRWILSRLQSLKNNISAEMEAYRLYNVVPALFEFIDDLTNWYIRLNRSRFWSEEDSFDKAAAYHTLFTTIHELSISMAPFAPFLAETIYRDLPLPPNAPESVHLCRYPEADDDLIQPMLEQAVTRMQHIVLLGRKKRNQEKVKIKYPLRELTIVHEDQVLLDEIAKLENYIKSELNIKELGYSTDEKKYINLYAKPNSPVLGKRLGKTFKQFKQKIEELSATDIALLQDSGELHIDTEVFTPDDILVFREPKEGTDALSNRFISINMDSTLTPDLIEEGLAREVINRIQRSRKDAGFNVSDRIEITFTASSDLRMAIGNHEDHIRHETLALKLEEVATELPLSFDVDGHSLSLALKVAD